MKGQMNGRGRDWARPGAGLARKLVGASISSAPTGSANEQSSLWLREEMWRHVFEGEVEKAGRLRWRLYRMGLYPTRRLGRDRRTAEANHRGALHVIVDELDATDVAALFDVARLLALVKRERGLFGRIARDEKAWIRRAEAWEI